MDDFALNTLRKLGFSDYQARVVYALLRLREADVREISKFAEIPRTKAYEVLKELRRKGYVVEIRTRPMRYSIVDPDGFIEKVYARKKKEMETLEKEVESLKRLLPALSKQGETAENYIIRTSSPEGVVELIRGRVKPPTIVGYTRESRNYLKGLGDTEVNSPIDFVLTPEELFIPLNPLGVPQREYVVVVFTNPYVMEIVRRWVEEVLLSE